MDEKRRSSEDLALGMEAFESGTDSEEVETLQEV